MKNLSLLIVLLFSMSTYAQEAIVGKWKTIDDETNKAKSIVEIFEKDGVLYGKIEKLWERNVPIDTESKAPLISKLVHGNFTKNAVNKNCYILFANEVDAKAACEADHRARVLAMLEPAPAAPGDAGRARAWGRRPRAPGPSSAPTRARR